jgi:hypothetical protein
MVVDEHSRYELGARLEEAIGRKDADALMAHPPPTTSAEVAARADLERLQLA